MMFVCYHNITVVCCCDPAMIPSASRIPDWDFFGAPCYLLCYRIGLEKVEAELRKVIEEVRSQALFRREYDA